MELQELKYFLLVMECGSFSKAAEKSFTTQPNISKNIASLEHTLNTTLFERRRNGVVPTAEAVVLAKRLRSVLAQIDQIFSSDKEKEDSEKAEEEVLRIGFSENMNIDVVASRFFAMLKDFDVTRNIQLQMYPAGDILQKIQDGTIDMGFVYSVYPIDASVFNRIAMTRNKPSLYYSANSRIAEKENLTVEDFENEVFVTYQFESDASYVKFNGLPFQPKHVIYVKNLMEISLYVNSGMGVAVLGPSQLISVGAEIRSIELEKATGMVGADAIWLNHNHKELLRNVIPCLLQL